MNPFTKFKRWLTLAESARALSSFFESEVTEADVLRLALDGQLQLSAVFIGDPVLCIRWHVVDPGGVEYMTLPGLSGGDPVPIPVRGPVIDLGDGTSIQKFDGTDRKLLRLDEDSPYELAMIGGEVGDVRQLYWQMIGEERGPTSNLDGTFVIAGDGEDRVILGLVEEFEASNERDYFDAGGLPKKTVLVVTPQALEAFLGATRQDAVSPPAVGRPAHWPWGNHQTKHLSHLEAAARRFWSNFEPSDPSTAPTNAQVAAWLEDRGVGASMAEKMATILRADGLPSGPRR